MWVRPLGGGDPLEGPRKGLAGGGRSGKERTGPSEDCPWRAQPGVSRGAGLRESGPSHQLMGSLALPRVSVPLCSTCPLQWTERVALLTLLLLLPHALDPPSKTLLEMFSCPLLPDSACLGPGFTRNRILWVTVCS